MYKKDGKDLKGDEKILHEAKESFTLAQDAWASNQKRYEADVKFGRLGDQWEAGALEERNQAGRPALTINRMPSFIRQVVNDARQNKPSIKVHPNDDRADPETAEVINGLIRNIEQTSKADLAYDTAIDCAASGGFGYFRIGMDYADDDTFDMDITIDRIVNPLTVYPDPDSLAADSSDWNQCHITEMMPRDEFEAKWPDADPVDWNPSNLSASDESWYEKDELRIAEFWQRVETNDTIHLMMSGDVIMDEVYQQLKDEYEALGNEIMETRQTTSHKVTQYIMNGQEILETNEWPGKYIPIVPVYGEEVYMDGERRFFSLIHFAKDAQRIFNYWRTTTTELIAMAPKAPYIGPTGSFNTDLDRWQNANTETTAFLEYDGDIPPQRQPFAGPPAGALQEALNAATDMQDVMGLHAADLGGKSNEISGVAIGKRVREGDTSTFHFSDNMSRAIRHGGQIIVGLIPHVYSRERMVRVLGEDGIPQTVKVNGEAAKEEEMLQGETVEQREAMENIYDLTVGKYDVTVKSGPNYTTQREEARESMMQLLSAFPQAAMVTGDLVVEAMDWPNADVFAKRLKSLLPPGVVDDKQDPRIAQMTQQMQGMEQVINQLMAGREEAQAKLDEERLHNQAKIQLDSRKIDIDAMRAETDRMEAGIKAQEAEIKAAEAMKEKAPDRSAIELKEMDLTAAAQQAAFEGEFKQQNLDIEKAKLELERDKLALDRWQAEVAAYMNAEGHV
jgi:hypothetical protein